MMQSQAPTSLRRIAGPFLAILIFVAFQARCGVAADTVADTAKPAKSAGDRAASEKLDSDKASPEKAAEKDGESLLGWLGRSLGARYVVIFLFLSVNLVALAAMNALAVRRDRIVPAELIRGLELRLSEDRIPEAHDLCKTDSSVLARVLNTGIRQLTSGYEKSLTAMQEYGALEALKMRERLGYLGLIAQLAPIFGLIGTVDGLIAAFDIISERNVTPRPSDLAGGVGTALVAMIVGLWIAAIAVLCHQVIRNRMNRLLAEAGILAERFIERFAAAHRNPSRGA